eukprot:11827416-Alexandrium_andersonii.AAC.1
MSCTATLVAGGVVGRVAATPPGAGGEAERERERRVREETAGIGGTRNEASRRCSSTSSRSG